MVLQFWFCLENAKHNEWWTFQLLSSTGLKEDFLHPLFSVDSLVCRHIRSRCHLLLSTLSLAVRYLCCHALLDPWDLVILLTTIGLCYQSLVCFESDVQPACWLIGVSVSCHCDYFGTLVTFLCLCLMQIESVSAHRENCSMLSSQLYLDFVSCIAHMWLVEVWFHSLAVFVDLSHLRKLVAFHNF